MRVEGTVIYSVEAVVAVVGSVGGWARERLRWVHFPLINVYIQVDSGVLCCIQ